MDMIECDMCGEIGNWLPLGILRKSGIKVDKTSIKILVNRKYREGMSNESFVCPDCLQVRL